MLSAVLDTHTLIWLLHGDPRLSKAAREAFDSAAAQGLLIGVSSISLVEIVYLEEKGRLAAGTLQRLSQEMSATDSPLAEIPIDWKIADSMRRVSRDEVPDMPDRIIAATALAAEVPLISRDRKIQLSTVPTIW